jgi:hypothetical protein
MNCFSWAETLPKRVGVPNSTASAHSMSSGVASGTPAVAAWLSAQAGLDSMADCGASSAALTSRTSAPAFRAASRSSRASSAVVPVEE